MEAAIINDTMFAGLAERRARALEYARTSRLEVARDRARRAFAWMDAHKLTCCVMLILAALATSLLAPTPALAVFDWNVFDPIQSIADMLSDGAAMFFSWAFGFLKGAADVDKILGDFNELLGTNASNLAYQATHVADSVVKTCANTVLVVVILVQLVKIASQIDRNGGTLPAVRDVFQLFVFMGIFMFLVNHASELMTGLFDLIQSVGSAIDRELDAKAIDAIEMALPEMNVGEALTWLFLGLITYVVALAASLITRVMAYARAFTIYVLTMFSPLAFSFLGMEVTKQWGIGYIKSYIGECLSGVVMVIVLWFYPFLIVSFLPGNGTIAAEAAPEVAVDILVSAIVLALLIVRSGGIAQKIIGGA